MDSALHATAPDNPCAAETRTGLDPHKAPGTRSNGVFASALTGQVGCQLAPCWQTKSISHPKKSSSPPSVLDFLCCFLCRLLDLLPCTDARGHQLNRCSGLILLLSGSQQKTHGRKLVVREIGSETELDTAPAVVYLRGGAIDHAECDERACFVEIGRHVRTSEIRCSPCRQAGSGVKC